MNFDFLAPHYRRMETVLAGGVLQRARVQWIDALEGRARVLIVGEGPGRLLEEVVRRFPRARVTVVEQSGLMIDVAKRRLSGAGISQDKVRWVLTDVRVWAEERVAATEGRTKAKRDGDSLLFEAVVTPFVLDCFTAVEMERVVGQLSAVATSHAVWLLADFQVPEAGWRRWRAKAVHALMYRFFRVTTTLEAKELTDPDEALRRGGFALKSRAVFNAGLVRSDWWERA
jgi:hypothetical protein